jgi:hypothetical protein
VGWSCPKLRLLPRGRRRISPRPSPDLPTALDLSASNSLGFI